MKTLTPILILLIASTVQSQDDSSSLSELRERYEVAEQQAAQTALLLREQDAADTEDPGQIASLKEQLTQRVQVAFESRLQLQERLLADAQTKLDSSRRRLRMRKEIADQIIARRVGELQSGLDTSWRSDLGALEEPKRMTSPIATSKESAVPEASDALSPYRLFLSNRIGELEQERGRLLEGIVSLEEDLDDLDSTVASNGDSPEESEQEEKRREQASATLKKQSESIKTDLDSTTRQIAALREKLSKTLRGGSAPLSISGKVVLVTNFGVAVVNIGTNDGLRKGMHLDVYRNGKYRDNLELTDVGPDTAKGKYTVSTDASQPTTVQVGDEVRLRFDSLGLAMIGRDQGESIYNDRLKRFKFKLEGISVADVAEVGQKFWRRHFDYLRRDVVGVWGDPSTNSLVVVARPEAEQMIRELIAHDEALSRTGFDPNRGDSLDEKLRMLMLSYEDSLEEAAECTVSLIEADAQSQPDEKRIAELTKRQEQANRELKVAADKLQVVKDAIKQRDELIPFFPRSPTLLGR